VGEKTGPNPTDRGKSTYKAGLEKFGNTPFFIKQVLDKDETPVWMR
jgi:hypothetical protein